MLFADLLARCMPRYDSANDGGGAGISDADFAALTKTMTEVAEGQEEMQKTVEETHEKIGTLEADNQIEIAKMGKELVAIKSTLAQSYGKSGADDFMQELSKYLSGMFWHRKEGKVPTECKMSNGMHVEELLNEKAAANFTTTVDATAGYTVPDILLPGITELRDLYGSLYPRVTTMNLAPGTSAKLNKDTLNPVAAWNGAEMAVMGQEATPMSFGQDTMLTEMLGTYIIISNELLNSPGVNFGSIATVRLLKAILRQLESSLLAGVASTAGPSDGIITAATNQGNIASATFANVIAFLKACMNDNDFAANTTDNALFMHPIDVLTLASQPVGATELTGMLTWGNPATGAPPTLMGYEIISHPAMTNGTLRCMALGDPKTIILAESPSYTIDINPHLKDAFLANSSWLRCFNHYDWHLGQLAEWHFTTVTA